MVKLSIQCGVSNISPYAFATYGINLVNEPDSDVDGGHLMGCTAIELMTRLGAVEVRHLEFGEVT